MRVGEHICDLILSCICCAENSRMPDVRGNVQVTESAVADCDLTGIIERERQRIVPFTVRIIESVIADDAERGCIARDLSYPCVGEGVGLDLVDVLVELQDKLLLVAGRIHNAGIFRAVADYGDWFVLIGLWYLQHIKFAVGAGVVKDLPAVAVLFEIKVRYRKIAQFFAGHTVLVYGIVFAVDGIILHGSQDIRTAAVDRRLYTVKMLSVRNLFRVSIGNAVHFDGRRVDQLSVGDVALYACFGGFLMPAYTTGEFCLCGTVIIRPTPLRFTEGVRSGDGHMLTPELRRADRAIGHLVIAAVFGTGGGDIILDHGRTALVGVDIVGGGDRDGFLPPAVIIKADILRNGVVALLNRRLRQQLAGIGAAVLRCAVADHGHAVDLAAVRKRAGEVCPGRYSVARRLVVRVNPVGIYLAAQRTVILVQTAELHLILSALCQPQRIVMPMVADGSFSVAVQG